MSMKPGKLVKHSQILAETVKKTKKQHQSLVFTVEGKLTEEAFAACKITGIELDELIQK